MTNMQGTLKNNLSPTFIEQFRAQLGMLTVVDVGVIQSLTADGYALVQTWRIKNTKYEYFTAEILVAGDAEGYLGNIREGQPCLIFFPCTSMDSLAEQKRNTADSLYAQETPKCIPLTFYRSEQDVIAGYNAGALSIGSSQLSTMFGKSEVRISSLPITFSVDSSTGSFYFNFGSGKGTLEGTKAGSLRLSAGSSQTASGEWYDRSNITVGEDGAISITQNSDKGEAVVNVSIATDGSIDIKQAANDASIRIDSSGAISVTGKSVSIESSSGAANVTGASASIDGSSGTVELKNSAYSLKDAFSDLITMLSASTAGSYTLTLNPAQLLTLQTKLEALFGE
jgi:hypothetical protein